MHRKEFLKLSGLAGLGVGLLPGTLYSHTHTIKLLSQMTDRIGIQLFSLPKLMGEDPKQSLELLVEMGYSEIELYGPYPFSAESNKKSWEQITQMLGFSGSGFFGLSQTKFQAFCRELGLSIPSLHTDLDSLEHHMPALGQAARQLGAKYVALPAIPPERRQTLDDYKRMADTFNSIGAAARNEGIRFAYHNHGYGLQETDGIIPFEMMLDATDPKAVFLEMDIFWTIAGKADPIAYLNKYKERYKMMHLKDMTELRYFSGDGGDPGQWVELFPLMTSTGSGVLDLEGIVNAASQAGVEHFFVEQDMVSNPEVALKESIVYLKEL
jgi:sugar phosphate isomerase/epimerase